MLMALASFMRLSSMKAAHVAVARGRVQEIRASRSFFARCGILLRHPFDSSVNIRLVQISLFSWAAHEAFTGLTRLRKTAQRKARVQLLCQVPGHGLQNVPGHRLQFCSYQSMLGRSQREGKWETRSVFRGGAADASAVPHRLGLERALARWERGSRRRARLQPCRKKLPNEGFSP
jgi:hypothetical protein